MLTRVVLMASCGNRTAPRVPAYRSRMSLKILEGSFASNENNLVHTERFRVYKLAIWAVKTEIVGIAPALGLRHMTECCPVQEYGGMQ
jgi:hypothetical protein